MKINCISRTKFYVKFHFYNMSVLYSSKEKLNWFVKLTNCIKITIKYQYRLHFIPGLRVSVDMISLKRDQIYLIVATLLSVSIQNSRQKL